MLPRIKTVSILILLDILPLIRLGLDSHTHTLVDAAIKCLPVVLPALDFSTVKNEVFPPIASTFSRTSSLGIKVRCLEAFTVLCGGTLDDGPPALEDELSGTVENKKSKSIKSSILDKYTIQEKLVPSLKATKTKEPAVMLAALNVFRQVGEIADTDFLALEVLPILWSFSLGPLLDLHQFGEFMSLIKNLSTKIEREQTRKLQELSSGDSGGFQNGTGSPFKASAEFGQSSVDSTRDNFERLVLGKGSAAPNSQDMNIWGDSVNPQLPPAHASNEGTVPEFSWSSNTTAAATTQAKPSFRTVTPDYNLNSFPSLQPAMQLKSPTGPAFPRLQPTSSGGGHQFPGNMRGPSSLASLSSSNTHTSGQMQQQTPAYSAFSIPPPPSTASPLGSYTTASAGPSTNRQSLGMMNTPNSFMQGGPPQPQGTQKQGLEKYESLL